MYMHPTREHFLPRHDEDLREPLVRRQGSQVSMRVARGRASWLSSHGRGKEKVRTRKNPIIIYWDKGGMVMSTLCIKEGHFVNFGKG